MASIINALTGGGGVAITGDTSGNLALQTNNGTTAVTLDTSQNATFVGYANMPNTFGFKNRIINGAMGIWQRGTSFTNISSGATITYGPDRWTGLRTGWAANLDFSRQTGFGGFPYCLRMQRTSGTTSTALLQASQFIESNNCSDLAGQTVTFSCWIRAGANYSGGSVGIAVYTGSGTDQGSLSCFSGTWTTFNSTSTSVSITTTATLYTFTTTIPAGTNEIAINLLYTPTGTAGASDYIEFTGVQLEKGSTATSFDYRDYGRELIMCQRYFEKSFNVDQVPANGASGTTFATGEGITSTVAGNNALWASIKFAVQKRAAPTITAYGNNSGYWTYVSSSASSTNNWSANTVIFGYQGYGGFSVAQNVTNNVYYTIMGHWTASSEL